MGNIKEVIERRKHYLIQVKNQIERSKKKKVQGKLRVCSRGNSFQYYLRDKPTDFNGSYKELVIPWIESEEDFLCKWQEYEFQGLGYAEDTPEFYTQKGERVRSKSELIIADMLEKENVPYRYECPIFLKGFGKVYPDFTVLNKRKKKELYWEHFGMMDDPVYAERAMKKIRTYEQNGYCAGLDLILTFESKNVPISQKQISNIIESFLK